MIIGHSDADRYISFFFFCQGYFQSLFSCIERLLVTLKVKHFVLPAADEAESIWTKKFGFMKITSDEVGTCACALL